MRTKKVGLQLKGEALFLFHPAPPRVRASTSVVTSGAETACTIQPNLEATPKLDTLYKPIVYSQVLVPVDRGGGD